MPVVEAVRNRFDCWISVDSSKAVVMREAANVGMDLINDIRALQRAECVRNGGKTGFTCLYYAYARATSHDASKSLL